METIITLSEHNGIRTITKSSVKPSSLEGLYEKWEHKNGSGMSFRFVLSSDDQKQKTMTLTTAVKKFVEELNKQKKSA